MNKLGQLYFAFSFIAAIALSGCYKLQKDYKYKTSVLDPHINMTAKDFLLTRGKAGENGDTVFKWMQLGIEYAGINLAEYEKPGRTYIFLHNNAIRTGFFLSYPIFVKDASGNQIKSVVNPAADSIRAATSWEDYPQQLVKNYFLYLILQGDYTFENLGVTNTTIQTLLPPGATADPNVSLLGWVVTQTQPNPDPTLAANIRFISPGGSGFDPEGKINLTLKSVSGTPEDAPITVNDRTPDRTAGYFATNGKVHVFDKTVHPFRYSY